MLHKKSEYTICRKHKRYRLASTSINKEREFKEFLESEKPEEFVLPEKLQKISVSHNKTFKYRIELIYI